MRMKDPIPTYTYLLDQIISKHPNLAYLHVIESRPAKNAESADPLGRPLAESNEFLRRKWAPRPYISAGGYSEAAGKEMALDAGEHNVLVAFGRSYIANPDLPVRIEKNIELTTADPSTFYLVESPVGYTDYPFAGETKA